MKVGDVVQLSPEYNQGKWGNAMALILAHKPEMGTDVIADELDHRGGSYRVEFYEVLCENEIWDAPDWSLLELNDESR